MKYHALMVADTLEIVPLKADRFDDADAEADALIESDDNTYTHCL